jgi:hypothetical protein
MLALVLNQVQHPSKTSTTALTVRPVDGAVAFEAMWWLAIASRIWSSAIYLANIASMIIKRLTAIPFFLRNGLQ